MDSILIVYPEINAPSTGLLNHETRLFAHDCDSAEIGPYDETDDTEEVVRDAQTFEEFYQKYVDRTPEQCLQELNAPQRSASWHAARKFCLTASNFGSAAGNNPYCSPHQCALEKLKKSKTNDAMRYGTANEPVARKTLIKLLETKLFRTLEIIYGGRLDGFELLESGLLKYAQKPWLAASPDGLLKLFGSLGDKWVLIEYKCPVRVSAVHPYSKSPFNIPPYYFDQIQGIMGLMNSYDDRKIQSCLFVVWQPEKIFITRSDFDLQYYAELEFKLKEWFFNIFGPLVTSFYRQ